MFCKTCHYPLKQLSELRCPECGRAFDPDDPRTYDVGRSLNKNRWFQLLILGGLTYLVMFLLSLNAILKSHAAALDTVNNVRGSSITFVAEPLSSKILQAAGVALLNWPCAFAGAFTICIAVIWATPYLIPRGLKNRRQ